MNSYERVFQDIDDALRQVGQNMTVAMQEVATELGGKDFAATVLVTAAFEPESLLPNPDALKLLQDRYPDADAAAEIIKRTRAIADEKYEIELAELHKHRFRRYGKALIGGFVSIGGGMASVGEGMSRINRAPSTNLPKKADHSDID
jgi:hypothetical protein